MVLVKLENYMQKNEIRFLSLTVHKTQLEDQGPQQKTRYPKSDIGETKYTLQLIDTGKDFPYKILVTQTLCLSTDKEHHHLSEEVAYRMRTKRSKLYIVVSRAYKVLKKKNKKAEHQENNN